MTRNGKKGSLNVDGVKGKLTTNAPSPLMRITTPFYVGNVATDVKLDKISGLVSFACSLEDEHEILHYCVLTFRTREWLDLEVVFAVYDLRTMMRVLSRKL